MDGSTPEGMMKTGLTTNFLYITFILFSILSQPSAALATNPRTMALGSSHFLTDDSNVLRWYGSLLQYGNQVVVESGHRDLSDRHDEADILSSGFGTGVHLDLGSEGRWGTAAFYYHEQMRDSFISTSIEDDPGECLTLMYAHDLGPLGVGLSVRHSSRQGTADEGSVYAWPPLPMDLSRTVVGLGIHADLSSTSFIDAAFDLQRMNWQDPPGYYSPENLDSGSNFSARLRASFAINPKMALVPVMEYWNESYLSKMKLINWMPSHHTRMGRLGCNLNLTPSDRSLFMISGDYRVIQDDIEGGGIRRLHQTNWIVASEYKWLTSVTLRGSLCLQYFNVDDTEFRIQDLSDSLVPLSMGAGFHLGQFDLDAAFSTHEPGLLNPNWEMVYSGNPSIQAPGSWFSASLRWGF